MNREEFMAKLKALLGDIPAEEREEALQYYEDYFDDAGADNEAEVIRELESPQRVAAMIKNDLKHTGNDGEFTENGYEQEWASDRSSLLFCSTGDCIAGSRTCRICSRGDRDRRRNRHSFSTCSTFDGRDWIDPDRAWSTGNIIYRKALHCNVSGDVSVYRETVPEAVSQKGGV